MTNLQRRCDQWGQRRPSRWKVSVPGSHVREAYELIETATVDRLLRDLGVKVRLRPPRYLSALSNSQSPAGFAKDPISTKWHLVQVPGKPLVHFCFSPHDDTGLSPSPLGAAIDQATSSVFFSIAFLYQTKSGPTREAIDRLMGEAPRST